LTCSGMTPWPARQLSVVLLHSHATALSHSHLPVVPRTSSPVYKCLGFGDGFATAGRRLGGTDTDVGRHQEPRDADISEVGLPGSAWRPERRQDLVL